jgi:hypothetical protein
MDSGTVRIICALLAVALITVIILRRRKRVE